MQIFIPYSDIHLVARCLDTRRLHKQIIEVGQIISAIKGVGRGWLHHPCVFMYRDYVGWLELYKHILEVERWRRGVRFNAFCSVSEGVANRKPYIYATSDAALKDTPISKGYTHSAETPPFIGYEPLHQAHRSRLWQKDHNWYGQFISDGDYTNCNWYVVGNEIRKYQNAKLVERVVVSDWTDER